MALVTKERVKTKDREGRSIIGRRFLTTSRGSRPATPTPTGCGSPRPRIWPPRFRSKAIQDGVAGHAAIKCNVTIEGLPGALPILSRVPPATASARRPCNSPQFRMSPKIRGGKPVGGEVTIPINWEARRRRMARGPPSAAPIADGPAVDAAPLA
jgi:hypothetical protein